MEKIIFSDILEHIDNSWSTLEKAKYIYTEICKKCQYDKRFIYSDNPDLINEIYNKKVDIDIPVEPNLICKQLNSIYLQLLNRIGIKNKIVEKSASIKEGYNDIALIIYDENNEPYFTAISGDIQRCKYGMKTQFFGGCDNNYPESSRNEVTVLSAEQLRSIDEKINYIKKNEDYSDSVFNLVSEEVKQSNEFKKNLVNAPNVVRNYLQQSGVLDVQNISDEEIKAIVSNYNMDDILQIKMMIVNYLKQNDTTYGYIENKKQCISIFNSIFNRSEKKRYDSFDMIRENGNNVEVLSIIRFKLNSDFLYYLYSQDTHEYELLPIEEAIKISEEYKSKSGAELIEER